MGKLIWDLTISVLKSFDTKVCMQIVLTVFVGWYFYDIAVSFDFFFYL